MAFGYRETCYSSEALALDAFFGSQNPAISFDSGNVVTVHYEKISGDWNQVTTIRDSSGVVLNSYNVIPASPVFYECETASDPVTQFNQGFEIGAALALVLVIAAIGRVLGGQNGS